MGGLDSSPMVLLLVLQLLKRLLFVSVESGAPIEADAARLRAQPSGFGDRGHEDGAGARADRVDCSAHDARISVR